MWELKKEPRLTLIVIPPKVKNSTRELVGANYQTAKLL